MFSSASLPPADRNITWCGVTSLRLHTGLEQRQQSRRYTCPHATFTPTRWLHACQNARQRNFTQLIPRGSQRRAHASSECHQLRKPSETRQRTSTRPALRFDSAVSLPADIWTAWVNAPCSSQAARLLNISRQGRAEGRRKPSSGG